jgi:hypothetical protein
MNQTLAVWLLIILAALAANLPFLTERIFGLFPFRRGGAPAVKPFWLRLGEALVLYFLIGFVGYAFEGELGNRFQQGWEFYAITLCLYVVLGYPGFVYRYLYRRGSKGASL